MSSPVVPSQFEAVISDPTATLCGNFKNTLLRFPSLFYTWFNWAFTSGGSVSNALKREIRPTGDYIFSAAPLAEDDSRLLCNGQAVVRTDYPELFTAIGTTYGDGNGTTTFNVPDWRDRFPVGVSGTKPLADTGGAASVDITLTQDQLPKHRHYIALEDTGSNALTMESELGYVGVVSGTSDWRPSVARTKGGQTRDTGPGTPGTQAVVTVPTVSPYIAAYIYIAT